jgi:hypothetical protein
MPDMISLFPLEERLWASQTHIGGTGVLLIDVGDEDHFRVLFISLTTFTKRG